MGQARCAATTAARLAIFAAALVVLEGALSLSPARGEAAFVPHRAIYGLSLARSLSGSTAVTHAVGKLEFTWADVCDGWAVTQRTHINLTNLDGSEVQFGWNLSSWESKDGLAYRFFVRRILGEGKLEELRGEATLSRPGGPGEAQFSLPKGTRLELPEGTIFPTRHSLVLLEAAARDGFPVWRVVFDGTGEEGLNGINAALVQALPATTPPSFDFDMIDGVRSWRLSMAHFALDNRSGEPAHEQSLRLFENGVVDELLLDYGEFALDAKLADLAPLPPPDC